ncbi:unnamed protein product [Echinostoma caproni]|uniref:Peptidase A2 domain-containing protein n=1 Tax=Echinostoma caproni TaxID=27848 RepID=A0A183AU12_9TREM|nr:unnamed protein product [Echinostoma caproni]
MCRLNHELSVCEKFAQLEVPDRWEAAKRHGETQLSAPQKPSVSLLSQSADKQVRLGVKAVGILTPSGVVKTMAFIDNGSDTTLITKRFTVKNIKTLPSSLTISTVNGTTAMSANQANVTLILLDNEE